MGRVWKMKVGGKDIFTHSGLGQREERPRHVFFYRARYEPGDIGTGGEKEEKICS